MTEPRATYLDSEHPKPRDTTRALEQALRKLEKATAALKQYANRNNGSSSSLTTEIPQ